MKYEVSEVHQCVAMSLNDEDATNQPGSSPKEEGGKQGTNID